MNVTVQVTITQGSNALVVNTTDAEAAFLGTIPSAVYTMTGQWSQPTGRDHPDPGRLTLELILATPIHAAIEYESLVEVEIALDGRDPIPFWRGWIEDLEISRRKVHDPDTRAPVTTWLWRLIAGDVFTRAAATKINLPPLPAQEPADKFAGATLVQGRLRTIADACPVPLISQGMWSAVTIDRDVDAWEYMTLCRPRDIDNVDVLSLCREIANMAALQLIETPTGIHIAMHVGAWDLYWVTVLSKGLIIEHNYLRWGRFKSGAILQWLDGVPTGITDIPAEAITETARKINRSSMLNEVSLGWYTGQGTSAGTETTGRNDYERNTTRQASTSQHRMASEYYISHNGTEPPGLPATARMVTRAKAMLALTQHPTRVLSEVVILLDNLPADIVEPMITMGLRSVAGLHISGSRPDDVPEDHRVIGGTFTVTGGRPELAATLEPATLSGLVPLAFDDIPAGQTTTYDDGTSVYVEATFGYAPRGAGEMPITFEHVALASIANNDLYRKV